MKALLAFLADIRTLVALPLVAIAIALCFGLVGPAIGGQQLDMIGSTQANLDRLAAMTSEQRVAHLWLTLTLDTVYPLTYGVLAGLAARLAPQWAIAAALPALLTILVDTGENVLIVAALLGDEGVIPFKVFVTHFKWWLFGTAGLIVIALTVQALGWALLARLRATAGRGMAPTAHAPSPLS